MKPKAENTFRIVTGVDTNYLLLRQAGYDLDLTDSPAFTVCLTRAKQAASAEEFMRHMERSTFMLN